MLKSIRTTVAVALVASAGFSGAAFASGDYYDGVSAEPTASVDLFQTSSIESSVAPAVRHAPAVATAGESVDHGEYYTGANRPQ